MATQEPLTLIQFQKKFATEEACHSHLFTMKWPEGFRCAKCGHDQFYESKTRKLKLYEQAMRLSSNCDRWNCYGKNAH